MWSEVVVTSITRTLVPLDYHILWYFEVGGKMLLLLLD